MATFLADLAAEYVIAVLVTATLAVGGIAWRKTSLRDRVRDWRDERWFRKVAPTLVEKQAAYMVHLRDVMDTFWRAQSASPDIVRERIREHVLEPIAGTLTTGPGERVKVVWYRPDEAGQNLRMYQQVGHTPEGQAAMRLPIGGGLAGRAYATGDLVWTHDCRNDERFQDVELSRADGAIVCAPIRRAGQVTGVLSVMSNWKGVFWLPERLYFEGLAAAIAAAETLEEGGPLADIPV